MLNEQNFNKFITELKKRLTVRDPSCTITAYQHQQGGIVVRIDYDKGCDHYLIENTIVGASWICLYNF